MRELKFRAWHPESESMIVFDLAKASKDQYIASHVCALLSNTHNEGEGLMMQFTGLTDKNGVDIYEGDLIKNNRGRTAEVVWHKFTASFDSKFVSDDGSALPKQDKSYGFHNADWKSETKIVGNIYENPELLEAEES